MNKFEKKLEKYAIKNLMYYIILLYILGTVIWHTDKLIYFKYLSLDFNMIAKFQLWRFITFMMTPIDENIILALLMLYIYYICGKAVENIIGTVRFNIFMIMGIILIILSSFIYYLFTGIPINVFHIDYLNTSIFLIFALLRPEDSIMLYFVVPVKAKWFSLIILGFFVVGIVSSFGRIEAIATLINVVIYMIFFEANIIRRRKRKNFKKNVNFSKTKTDEKIAKHRCNICGKTDLTNLDMEFRYCSKCTGMKEYCEEHIHSHEHN